jgi:hypothetical protein
MGCLCTNPDDFRGVVGDVFIVEREAGGTYEFGVAMFGFVLDGLLTASVRMAVREWTPFS